MKSKAGDDTKKEHFVPRFYLEKFSNRSPSGKERKIWVFNKMTQTIYPSDIKDTATDGRFYDFLDDFIEEDMKKIFDTDLQRFENFTAPFYQKFENRLFYISKSINKQNHKIKVLKERQKYFWSYILAIQALRTPKSRNLLNEVKEKADKEIIIQNLLEKNIDDSVKNIKSHFPKLDTEEINNIKRFLFDETFQTIDNLYTEKSISIAHYSLFCNYIKKLSKVFLKHKWMIGINSTDTLFYTSDHPIVTIPYYETGYASDGVEILFPINSKVIFIIRDKNYFRNNEGDCSLINLSTEEVINYNKSQIFCSNKFLYCQENNFELAQEICRNNPDALQVNNNVKFI